MDIVERPLHNSEYMIRQVERRGNEDHGEKDKQHRV
jgi:hypothetical protein